MGTGGVSDGYVKSVSDGYTLKQIIHRPRSGGVSDGYGLRIAFDVGFDEVDEMRARVRWGNSFLTDPVKIVCLQPLQAPFTGVEACFAERIPVKLARG